MKRAFTIIELLVVIGIIGILMGILVASFSGSSESARAVKCLAHLRNLGMAVQSVGAHSGHGYPRATSIQYHPQAGKRDVETMCNWLGDATDDPYATSADIRENCFATKNTGTIWEAMKHDRGSYVCPEHSRYAKDNNKPAEPLWSYAMSMYFDKTRDSGKAQPSAENLRRGYPLTRADRTLLFAEVPFAKRSMAGEEIQSGNPSAAELDPALDYKSGEVIGFNHLDSKKRPVAHVCFADGHVEKLRAPTTKNNIKDLTEWLCKPSDDNGDFDINFDGKTYTQDRREATESAEE